VVIKKLEHEEAKARYRAVKIQPQWVVMPGKQTNPAINDCFNVTKLLGNKQI
jgi:hypothetical protein